ncbi:MAG: glycolate oxidase subunit GlcD [Synechococcaceae cyanobacterium RL_1_2]|nr:glycolate oxidase subunit GlcD [Synechococcaceae cyanobacterium RL_1_2]
MVFTTTAPAQLRSLVKQFEEILGKDGVVTRKEEILTYECDGLPAYRQRPAIVTLPRTTEQVARIIKLCHGHQVPWVARGAGTGLSGGALPIKDGVLIVTARMKEIISIDLENQRIVVQPGVINNWVTQAVSGAGFYYAPDPSSQVICSIGGNVAENSGGVHCLKYGVTTNHVLGLKVVLPDGEVVDWGGDVAEQPGYDLTGVFVGSEGTLGIATEVTLRILKVAEAISAIVADFTSIEAAGQTVADILQAGIIPAGMEIMDNITINIVEDFLGLDRYPRDAAAVLIIELDGSVVEVTENKTKVKTICQRNGSRSFVCADDGPTRLELWKGRKAAFGAAGQVSPDYFVQDGVIPRTQLAPVLSQIKELSDRYGYPVMNVFHAGDGNLHPIILFDSKKEGALEEVEALGGEILKLCVEVGGSISGEHGIGSDKREYMRDMFTELDLETMNWLRQAFDPSGLANPQKLLPTPRSCREYITAERPELAQ